MEPVAALVASAIEGRRRADLASALADALDPALAGRVQNIALLIPRTTVTAHSISERACSSVGHVDHFQLPVSIKAECTPIRCPEGSRLNAVGSTQRAAFQTIE